MSVLYRAMYRWRAGGRAPLDERGARVANGFERPPRAHAALAPPPIHGDGPVSVGVMLAGMVRR